MPDYNHERTKHEGPDSMQKRPDIAGEEPVDDSMYSGPSITKRWNPDDELYRVPPSQSGVSRAIFGTDNLPTFADPYEASAEKVYICANEKCKKAHRSGDKTFFTFVGDVHVGLTDGIIGVNLQQFNGLQIVRRITVYCFSCGITHLQECADRALGRRER